MPTRDGEVWLAEDEDCESYGGVVYTARFSGNHDRRGEPVAEINGAELEEALAWARMRSDHVFLRLADTGYFSAGEITEADMPPWPADRTVIRRRPRGEAWRDRRDSDAPIAWSVYVTLSPYSHVEPADWDSEVARLAEAMGAVRWQRSTWTPTPTGRFSYAPAPADEFPAISGMPGGDLDGKAILPAGEPPEGFVGFLTDYRLQITVSAPTADAAMRAAARRCADPRWSVWAVAEPA